MRPADDIFHDAREITDPDRRAAYLDEACGGDADLRAVVEQLLRADAELGGFLASRAGGQTTLEPVPLSERAGSRIGPYKLLQIIGEGGFGTVFLAEQDQPLRRKVAVKVIKLGMDSRQVIARFEAERQALAVMNHPHIARVFDGGVTEAGRPYFVMEYVVGDAITPFCDAHKLSVHERLDLFQQVCAAVQHAHTKGIIHRDLKPANVLVSMVDGKPFAKVIDFGIAKATASPLTDKTLFTEHRQLIGTPEYMSPEQAEGSPDIDTRTDVYALGVLLYELLTGLTPFDAKRLRSAAYAEMQRIIKEEEPPAPSLRLVRSLGTLATAAATRGVEPGRLGSLVKGELDWIVMKALDKDRARRYETAVALAADVQRHLSGEAVVAAPPSAGYRVRKFVRRNRGPVIAGSAVAAALLVGLAGTTIGLWRADIERDRARTANVALVAQSNIAKASIEDAVKRIHQSDLVLDASPALPTDPDYELQPTWTSREEDGSWVDDGFSIHKRHRDGTQLPLSGDEVLPALTAYLSASLDYAIDANKELRTQTDAAEWSAYTANLALAQAAMDAGNWPEARERLAQCPESKRGWEWRFADLLSQSTIMHATQCNRGTTSPDGTRIAFWNSGGYDIRNEVYVRSIDYPREVVALQWLGDWEVIRTVAWSPDGRRLLATSSDDTCHIINADGSGKARMLQAGERCARFAAWSPNGSYILTLSNEGDIRVWDSYEPNAPRTVKQGAQSAAWSPDGRRIASTMPDGSVVVLNADGSGETVIHHHDQVGHWSLAWNPYGERLVTYSNLNDDNRAFVIRADGAGEPLVVSGGRGAAQDAAWSPDGSNLIIGFHRGPAMIMRVDAPHEPLMLSGHADGVSSVTWSRDGARAFTSSSDGICVWDAATGSLVGRAITEPSDDSWTMSNTRGSTLVASNFSAYHFGSYEAMSKLIVLEAWGGPDLRFHEQFWELPLSLYVDALMSSVREAPITGRSVTTPDGSRRIEADGRVIRFIDAKADRELAVLRTSAHVTHLTLTGDGTRLILHHADLPARVWDIRDPEERRAEMVRAWAERAPAGSYLDTLLAGPTPTAELENAVISDSSLTPLRRLVAAEMLLERLTHIDRTASTTFESILRDAERSTDAITMVDTKAIKAQIKAAAAALQPSDALPPRAIEKVVAQAESWEYRPSTPPAEERLAQERLDRQLTEAKRISDAADEEPILRDMIRQALADQIELLGIDDPAVPLTLSRFGAFSYTHGLSLSSSDWPTAQRIVDAWRANPLASQTDLARAFAGAAAIAVDAGEFESAAELFAEFALIPADARKDLTPYFSVWLCLPSGVWEGEVTEAEVRSRAIAAFADSLAGWHEQLQMRPDSETRHIRELLDWLEGIPAYREPLYADIALLRYRLQDDEGVIGMDPGENATVLAAIASSRARLASSSRDEVTRATHLAAARSALSRARAIMADPNAVNDAGVPWSQDPDAIALLAEAEAMIEVGEVSSE